METPSSSPPPFPRWKRLLFADLGVPGKIVGVGAHLLFHVMPLVAFLGILHIWPLANQSNRISLLRDLHLPAITEPSADAQWQTTDDCCGGIALTPTDDSSSLRLLMLSAGAGVQRYALSMEVRLDDQAEARLILPAGEYQAELFMQGGRPVRLLLADASTKAGPSDDLARHILAPDVSTWVRVLVVPLAGNRVSLKVSTEETTFVDWTGDQSQLVLSADVREKISPDQTHAFGVASATGGVAIGRMSLQKL